MNIKLLIGSLFVLNIVFGQFGKNIVQYDKFDWQYIQTKHFDIYTYENGTIHSKTASIYLEQAYDRISAALDWRLKNRVSIIIYNSHNDFQQTNVINTYMSEGIGGVTELYKNRVVIPFDGSNIEFKHVIFHELVHAFINDYLYGGSYKNFMNSPGKVVIPHWMNEGLAEHLSDYWSTNSDMWMRDLTINGNNLPGIRDLNGYLGYRGGQSIWKFITEKWGNEVIPEIFYQIKKTNNINLGFKNAIGIDLKKLDEQWQAYLKSEYWSEINFRDNLKDVSRQLTNHIKLENNYNIAPALSPDGSRIAIFSNKSGPMGLYLISSQDGRFLEKVIQGERSSNYEELHILKPGITWNPNGEQIAFAAKSRKSDVLFIKNLFNNKTVKKRFDLEGIFRPSWSPNKNNIAFIGNDGSKSDIYLYYIKEDSLENLTNDWFSDDQVSWSDDGKLIYFISDRENYINVESSMFPNDDMMNHDFQYDIYSYSIMDKQIKRITNSKHNESYPCALEKNKGIYFISDESGINNIYIHTFEDNKTIPITNISTGITQLSFNGDENQLIFTGFFQSGYDIYILSNPQSASNNISSLVKCKWKEDKKQLKYLSSNVSLETEKNKSHVDYQNYIFAEENNSLNMTGSDQFSQIEMFDSTGFNYLAKKYKTRFTLDFAQINASYDSRFGTSGMAYFTFSDILGDHRVSIGTEMQITIKDSDYFIFYNYLKNKIDWDFGLSHRSYSQAIGSNSELVQELFSDLDDINNIATLRRIRHLELNVNGNYPLSKFTRIENGMNYNYYEHAQIMHIWTSDGMHYDNEKIINSFSTMVLQSKYTWDNTLWNFTFPNRGSRMFLKYNVSPLIKDNMYHFQTLEFDARGYLKIGDAVSFASRIFRAKSWGRNPKLYRLGDPLWILAGLSDYNHVSENQIEDTFYSEFVHPVRGHVISQKYGFQTLLINLEFRLPFLIYYFPTIKYLGQINGVIFIDSGSAWNSKFKNPFKVDSWNDIDDNEGWIMSYGFGPRFILLGLPVQLDYSWQYNPFKGKVSDRQWQMRIGLDF